MTDETLEFDQKRTWKLRNVVKGLAELPDPGAEGFTEAYSALRAEAIFLIADEKTRRSMSTKAGREQSIIAKKQAAIQRRDAVRPVILDIIASGTTGFTSIGKELLKRGFKPPRADSWSWHSLYKIAPEIGGKKISPSESA